MLFLLDGTDKKEIYEVYLLLKHSTKQDKADNTIQKTLHTVIKNELSEVCNIVCSQEEIR